MKKIIILITLLIFITACGNSTETEADNTGAEYEPIIWVDKENGCNYFIYETGAFQGGVDMEPRMNPDGTQYCIGGN